MNVATAHAWASHWYPLNDANFGDGFTLPPGTTVSAVSRQPECIDLFAVGKDGAVYTTFTFNGSKGWNGHWHRLADPNFGDGFTLNWGTTVSCVSRTPDSLDIFALGKNETVYTTFAGPQGWDGHWYPLNDANFGDGFTLPPGTTVSAVSRQPECIDLFAVGKNETVYTTSSGGTTFNGKITSGGLAALGGWANITVCGDGTTVWEGHAHNSGADGYDFGVSAFLTDRRGHAVAFSHFGHVGGTFTPGSRDHNWNQVNPRNDIVAKYYDGFAAGEAKFNTQYSSDIGSALETALGVVAGWVVGANPVGAAAGLVVFVGVEVGALISTGSPVPGARLVEGILWLAGPSNTLLALVAAGIADAGSQTRALTDDEYKWADGEVFQGTLPPRDKIVLTDTIGGGDRAFTFPRFDGKITLNMGKEGFDDPRHYHTDPNKYDKNHRRVYGEVFIHELTHSWQIAHTPMTQALLADAFASKICEATGGDPYQYEISGQSFGTFNLEQQAQIVSDWFARGKDENLPNYRYIVENVRTGQY